MQAYTFSGYLTRDPEMRYTGEGTAVTNMRVGVKQNRQLRDDEKEVFWPVTVWGKQAESVAEYLRKGSYAVVSGEIRLRTYEVEGETREQYFVNASSVEFGPRKDGESDGQQPPQQGSRQRRGQQQRQAPPPQDDFDDLPF